MMRRLLALLGFALVLAAASPDPVKVTGDKFVIDESQHTATFTGNVYLERSSLKLWAAKLVVEYGTGGPSDISSFVATGNVRIKTSQQDATGNKAVYNPNTKMLRLSGNVMVVNKSGTVGSPDLLVNLESNLTVFTGGKAGRVTGVFTPQ